MYRSFSENTLLTLEDLFSDSSSSRVSEINIRAIRKLLEKAEQKNQTMLANTEQEMRMFHSLQFEEAEFIGVEVNPFFLLPQEEDSFATYDGINLVAREVTE